MHYLKCWGTWVDLWCVHLLLLSYYSWNIKERPKKKEHFLVIWRLTLLHSLRIPSTDQSVCLVFRSWFKPETHNLVSVARWSLLHTKTSPIWACDTATEEIRLVAAIHQCLPLHGEMKQPGKRKPTLASWLMFPSLTGKSECCGDWTGEGPDPDITT